MKFRIPKDYISYEDAGKVQEMAQSLFENFDGGWGVFTDDKYQMHQPFPVERGSIGFLTGEPNSRDIATLTWPPNKLSMEDYIPYQKSIRFTIFEVLYELCKGFGVEFSPSKECIQNCYNIFKQDDE